MDFTLSCAICLRIIFSQFNFMAIFLFQTIYKITDFFEKLVWTPSAFLKYPWVIILCITLNIALSIAGQQTFQLKKYSPPPPLHMPKYQMQRPLELFNAKWTNSDLKGLLTKKLNWFSDYRAFWLTGLLTNGPSDQLAFWLKGLLTNGPSD